MAESNPLAFNDPARLARDFEHVLAHLEAARSFGKAMQQEKLLARAQKLLRSREGIEQLYTFAPRFDAGGVFVGSDWAEPQSLQPALVSGTLRAGGLNATLEALSELRMLAIAEGLQSAPIEAADAREFLRDILASNLDLLFPVATEASREADPAAAAQVQALFAFIADRIGIAAILSDLIGEVERVLLQRPIMVGRAQSLLRSAGRAIADLEEDATVTTARRWIAALEGPSTLAQSCRLDDYPAALAECDHAGLAAEAEIFSRAMHETGLVSPQHADLLRHLLDTAPDLLGTALGVDDVGQVSLARHAGLVVELIRFAIHRETAGAIYGLSKLLCAGLLFYRPVAPGLRRLMVLNVTPEVAAELRQASQWRTPPEANVMLVAGTLSVLGQPCGVDQGHNPTCQSARAISLWAQNDVGYLLELIATAARDDDLVMDIEGVAIHSSKLATSMGRTLHTELDTVSLLLTPHIDRIYVSMGQYTVGRPGDGHRWINPELHGWWVQRGFAQLIDAASGAITQCEQFIGTFYAAYHPFYNGGQDLVYAQPCGVVTTDHAGDFVGLHAISIQRIAPDPEGVWRVYFFNPNRDKGQNWGQGVVTSTYARGELEGESSLPFEQFVSRLYVFHYKEREIGELAAIPAATLAGVRAAIAASWGQRFAWAD